MTRKTTDLIFNAESGSDPFIEKVADSAHFNYHFASDSREAITRLADNPDSILIFGDIHRAKITELNIDLKKFPYLEKNNVHLLVSTEEFKKLKDAFIVSPIGTVIVKPAPGCDYSINCYTKLLKSYLLKEELCFGVFFSDQTNVYNFNLTSDLEIGSIIKDSTNILAKLGFRTRVSNTVISSLEEVLLNAFYNAPVDTKGKCLYSSNVNPSLSNAFPDFRPILVQIGVDSDVIGLKVTDRYGSLNRTKFFLKLSKLFSESPLAVEHSSVGAGLGLSLVFIQGGSLFINVTPGIKTEVHVFFKASKHIKDFRTQFRFLATYFYPTKNSKLV